MIAQVYNYVPLNEKYVFNLLLERYCVLKNSHNFQCAKSGAFKEPNQIGNNALTNIESLRSIPVGRKTKSVDVVVQLDVFDAPLESLRGA